MIRSNRRAVGKSSVKSCFLRKILSFHRLFAAFSRACSIESSSISIPVMCRVGALCASMRAISPEPQPTSRASCACPISAHEPRSTPSVPTFMAQRSCFTVNCLNLNDSLFNYHACPSVGVGFGAVLDSTEQVIEFCRYWTWLSVF